MNEVYPSDCLTYGFLVNPDQGYYKLDGQEDIIRPQHSPTIASSSTSSLQVKLKNQEAKPPQSPSRTEESEPDTPDRTSDHGATSVIDQSASGKSPGVSPRLPDSLDEAIEEAKAIQDLVSMMIT